MGSTNKTTNYGLSQFIASDKPAWLVDYNGDMEKIDEGMEENKQSAEGNSTKITQIETNLEQVTQTVQNQGTTLQEYGTTLTQHTTLIGQNSQNISQLQGSVNSLEEVVDERENDIWVFIAGTDGIGVKDGTWKTSWIGYAMEYINRPDTRVVVLTNQGAGMVQPGLSGQNFLGMLQNANISNKALVTRIYIGSNNADNLNTTNYINYWLNFMQYCRNNFTNAKVELLDYWYNYQEYDVFYNHNTFLSNLQSTGIGINSSFSSKVFRKSWFSSGNYTDAGQHIIGQKIANYLITNSFDISMPRLTISGQTQFIKPVTGITLHNTTTISIQERGSYINIIIPLYFKIDGAGEVGNSIILGELIAEPFSNIFNMNVNYRNGQTGSIGFGLLDAKIIDNKTMLVLETYLGNIVYKGVVYSMRNMDEYVEHI